jgi:hypothetical protein
MQRIQRIEGLIQKIESSADPGTKAGVRELVEALLEYHGAGLGRILELAGEGSTREFARDPLIASMLLLYDLHPDDFETRVRRAVDGLPGVLLISAAEGVVRLRSTSAHTVRDAVEQALFEVAPEIVAIDIEGLPASSFVPLEALQRAV